MSISINKKIDTTALTQLTQNSVKTEETVDAQKAAQTEQIETVEEIKNENILQEEAAPLVEETVDENLLLAYNGIAIGGNSQTTANANTTTVDTINIQEEASKVEETPEIVDEVPVQATEEDYDPSLADETFVKVASTESALTIDTSYINKSPLSIDYKANATRTTYSEARAYAYSDILTMAYSDLEKLGDSIKQQLQLKMGSSYSPSTIQNTITKAIQETLVSFDENKKNKRTSANSDDECFAYVRRSIFDTEGKYEYNLQNLVNTFISNFNDISQQKYDNKTTKDEAQATKDNIEANRENLKDQMTTYISAPFVELRFDDTLNSIINSINISNYDGVNDSLNAKLYSGIVNVEADSAKDLINEVSSMLNKTKDYYSSLYGVNFSQSPLSSSFNNACNEVLSALGNSSSCSLTTISTKFESLIAQCVGDFYDSEYQTNLEQEKASAAENEKNRLENEIKEQTETDLKAQISEQAKADAIEKIKAEAETDAKAEIAEQIKNQIIDSVTQSITNSITSQFNAEEAAKAAQKAAEEAAKIAEQEAAQRAAEEAEREAALKAKIEISENTTNTLKDPTESLSKVAFTGSEEQLTKDITEAPEVAEEIGTTEVPEVAEEVDATEIPEVAEEVGTTEVPEVAEEVDATEIPEVAEPEIPEETEEEKLARLQARIDEAIANAIANINFEPAINSAIARATNEINQKIEDTLANSDDKIKDAINDAITNASSGIQNAVDSAITAAQDDINKAADAAAEKVERDSIIQSQKLTTLNGTNGYTFQIANNTTERKLADGQSYTSTPQNEYAATITLTASDGTVSTINVKCGTQVPASQIDELGEILKNMSAQNIQDLLNEGCDIALTEKIPTTDTNIEDDEPTQNLSKYVGCENTIYLAFQSDAIDEKTGLPLTGIKDEYLIHELGHAMDSTANSDYSSLSVGELKIGSLLGSSATSAKRTLDEVFDIVKQTFLKLNDFYGMNSVQDFFAEYYTCKSIGSSSNGAGTIYRILKNSSNTYAQTLLKAMDALLEQIRSTDIADRQNGRQVALNEVDSSKISQKTDNWDNASEWNTTDSQVPETVAKAEIYDATTGYASINTSKDEMLKLWEEAYTV